MNEKPNNEFALASNRPEDAERAPLRPVLWSELTARLAAMRDLRQSLADISTHRSPSFSSLAESPPRSSSALANPEEDFGHEVHWVNEKTRSVNLKALANGKAAQRNTSVDPNGPKSGDRELK